MAFNPTLRHLTTRLDGGVVWAASTEYLADNIVIYLDASYRCLVNHTSGSSFVTDLLANKWVKLSASVVNYIANSSALVDTSGYSAYADAAGTAPVDGTGGSPSVTFARSTTTPLRGIADFNFTKPAGASYQGNGVSYDFTIDNADLAKVLSVTFDYEVVSGTYSDGDLTVYLIQDPTGTPTVIQPAGYTILSGTAGTKLTQNATFQTASNVTSYRLCFHCASSTNTSAYVIAMDNISVSPQRTVQGAAVSDWQSYTPTWTAVTLNPSIGNGTISGKYRRVGDSLQISIGIVAGSSTTFGTGAYSFSYPSGFTLDTSKLESASTIPICGVAQGNAGGNTQIGSVEAYTNYFRIRGALNVGSAQWSNAYPATWVSGQAMTIFATVPMTGLSSNTVMSQDTDTRVVAMYASTASGTITGAPSDVTWSTISKDTHGSFNGVTYTVPVSGYYQISGQVRIAATYVAGNAVGIALNVNSSNVMYGLARAGGAQVDVSPTLTTIRYLNAGDLVKIQVDSAGTSPSFSGGGTYNYLSLNRLSGPATIASSETVACRFTDISGASFAGADTLFKYQTKDYDTHSAYSTTTGLYTIPVSGKYLIESFVTTASVTLTTGQALAINVYKNGSFFCELGNTKGNGSTSAYRVGGVDQINLLAGDTISFYVNTAGVATSGNTAAGQNRFSIVRVGN